MKKIKKINSCFKKGFFHVGRVDMWGNYCPENGEYYLAIKDDTGRHVVLASGCYWEDGQWVEQIASGYSYKVVRELLQLGHLTVKTLETFTAEGGCVWWSQPSCK